MGKNCKKIAFYLFFLVQVAILLLPSSSMAAGEVVLNSPTNSCTNSEAQVSLTWSWNDTGSPTFHILRKMEGEAVYADIGQTTELYYNDSPVISDKYYDYQIKAVRGVDEFFSEIERANAAYCPPAIESIDRDCQSDGPHFDLSWTSISGDLNIYNIWRQKDSGGYFLLDSITETSYNDGPSIAGMSIYDYFIEAIWQDANSSSSDIASMRAPACPPVLTASIGCETDSAPGGPQVYLSWNELLGVDYYQIYRKALGESNYSLLSGAGNITDTSYTDELVNSLSNNYDEIGNISYYIKAVWEGSAERDSSSKQVTLPKCAPFLTVGTNCDEAAFYLSWTATQGADHYLVYSDGGYEAPDVYGLESVRAPLDCSSSGVCTHSYQISAVAVGGNPWSNLVEKEMDCSSTEPPSPAPVMDDPFAYCESGDSRIDVSWSPSDNIIYYGLWRNGSEILNTGTSSFTDAGVQIGSDYNYWVRAYGSGGQTDSTNSVTSTAVGCETPSVPSINLSPGCDEGSPYVNISWSETTNTVTYEIYKGLAAGSLVLTRTFEEGSPEFSSRSWDDTNVFASTEYFYRIVSVGPPGVGGSGSDVDSTVPSDCDPTTPILILSNDCNGGSPEVDLSWSTDEANTTGYEIFRADYMGGTKPIHIILNPSTKTWIDNSVGPEISYSYKVEAVGYNDQRATEGYKDITTYNCSPPGSFILTNDKNSCMGAYPWSRLIWTDSSHADYYNLERNLYSGGSIIDTDTILGVESPYLDKGFGNALDYGGWNDYVDFGHPDSLDFGANTDFSGSFWVRFDSYPSDYKDFVGQFMPGYEVGFGNSHNLRFLIYDQSYNAGSIYSSFVPDLGEWYHIAFTADRDGDAILYANGNEIGRNSISHVGDITNNSDPLKVNDILDDIVNCVFDEFRIYARVLPPVEIQQHYNGVYSNDTDARGIWHFDEGLGNSVSDASDYRNNGIIVGDLTWVEVGPRNGEEHSWQGIAYNQAGNTRSNLTAPATMPICPPNKPGFGAGQTCDTGVSGIEMSWSFAINTETYNIYRDSILVESFSSGDPEFSNRGWIDDNGGAGLNPGQDYTYYVESVGSTGLTAESINRIVEAPNCSTSTFEIHLAALSSCNGHYPQVNLNWNGTSSILYYKVFRTDSLPMEAGDLLATTTNINYLDEYPSVQVNSTYWYEIVGHSIGGDGAPSDPPDRVDVEYCPPSQPQIDYLTTKCENFTPVNNLSWTDDTPFNTVQYAIYRNTTGNPPTGGEIINTVSASPYEDNDPTLGSNTTYYYWVEAESYIPDEDIMSVMWSVNTYNCNIVPGIPTLNSVNTSCCQNDPCNTIAWTGGTDAMSHNVYRVNPDLSVSSLSTRLSPMLDRGDFALEFDEDNGDEVEISDSSSLQISDSSSPSFSIEAWIDLDNKYNSYDYYLGSINGYHNNNIGIRWGDDLYFRGDFRSGGSYVVYSEFGPEINGSGWTHVIYVWDKEGDSERWYVDGILESDESINDAHDYLRYSSYDLEIGKGYWDTSDFEGMVDGARLYGRAIDDDEAWDHFSGIYNNELELAGAWHFDEGGSIPTPDSSCNGNEGTIYGASSIPGGRIGRAFDFDGNDDYINCGNDSSLQITGDLSIEFWMYDRDRTGFPLTKSYNGEYGMEFGSGGRIMFYHGDGPDYSAFSCGGIWETPGDLNKWAHIVIVRDVSDQSIDFYKNGSLICENVHASGGSDGTWHDPITDTWPMRIAVGQEGGHPNTNVFGGIIDEVRIYDRALDSIEVSEHHSGIFDDETGLKGWWELEEGAPFVIRDSSGNGNDGYISINNQDKWIRISSLEREADYTYYVKACGVGNESDQSNSISDTSQSCSSAINDFGVVGRCDGIESEIYSYWDADNYSYANLYKNREGESPALLAVLDSCQNDYTDTNVESEQVYEYYIEIFGDDGSSIFSPVESTTAPVCADAPEKPDITLTATCLGTARNDMLIEWNGDSGGNTFSYEIWGSIATNPLALIDTVAGGESSYSYRDTGLIPLTQYKYQVVAKGSTIDNPSDIKTETTYDCANWVPIPPPHLEVSSGYPVSEWDGLAFYQAVSLTWSDCFNEEEVEIYRRLTGSVLWGFPIATTDMDVVAYVDYDVDEEQDYDYKIVAVNKNGTTSGDNILQVTIPVAAPSPPDLSISWTGDIIDPAELIWTEASSTPAGMITATISAAYIVEKDDSKDFTTTEVCKIEDGSLTCSDLTPDTSEPFYRVLAKNRAGVTSSNIVELIPVIEQAEWREIIPR